jgi:hypothetical protein
LVLRAGESLQAKTALELVTACHEYQLQRIDSGVARFAPNCMAAGDLRFTNFASILENQRPLDNYWVFLSPQVTDSEWDQRVALNCYLLGWDRAAFEAEQRAAFQLIAGGGWGPWTRDGNDGKRRIESRLEAFDSVVKDPESALKRYGVRYLGLRARTPPAYLASGRWTHIQDGPVWQVWERSDQPAP